MKTKDFNNRNNVEAFEIGVDENLDIWDRDSGYNPPRRKAKNLMTSITFRFTFYI